MTGNVWEWTSGWYAREKGGSILQPRRRRPERAGYVRTVRGGSWDSSPQNLRISRRVGLSPADRHNLYVGFRCARDGSGLPTDGLTATANTHMIKCYARH